MSAVSQNQPGMVGIWKAAGERHPGAMNIVRSIEISSDRFSVSEHLKKILMNTAREMGWI